MDLLIIIFTSICLDNLNTLFIETKIVGPGWTI